MSEQKCSCEKFERLEGASVPAYVRAFLDEASRPGEQAGKNLYRCRICGREWEKRAPASAEEGRRPALVRVS